LAIFARHGSLDAYWLEVMIVLHYVLAGVGMFYLARSYELRRVSSLFSGVAFMLSGFMIAHAIHQQIICQSAWYPLILLLFRRALYRREWIWVFVTAMVLGHSVLAGFPQLLLYLYSFLAVVFAFEFLTAYRGKTFLSRGALITAGKAVAIVILSIAVSSFQLLPTIELSPLSQRAEITYTTSTVGSLSWGQLLTFLYPKFFGTSTSEQYAYWGPEEYWHYWETCVYLGTLTLLLAIVSLPLARRNKHIFFYWGVGLFALLYSLGGNFPLHALIFHYVPGFSLFRNPARAAVLITLATTLLAGWSLDSFLFGEREPKTLRTQRMLLLTVAGAGGLIWLLTMSGAFTPAFSFLRNPQIASLVQQSTLVGAVLLAVSGVLVFALLRRRWQLTMITACLLLFHLVDLTLFGGRQPLSQVNPTEYFGRTHQIVDALKQEGRNEIFRINTRTTGGLIMDRNQGMIDRIFMAEGYTPLALKRAYAPLASSTQFLDLLNIKYKTVSDEKNRISFVPHPSYLPRAFFLYKIHVATSDSSLVHYLKSTEFDHRTTAVFEKDPGLAVSSFDSVPSWKATIASYEINSILLDVSTSHDGVLVLSEIYYPGWNATIDGTAVEVYRVDYNLRGLIVPKGTHTVAFRFEPQSFERGAKITFAALGLSLFGIGVSLWRRRKSKSSQGA
jgi:hypothetical protein